MKKMFLISSIILIIIAAMGALKFGETNYIRIGKVESDFIVLSNGNYELDKNINLESNQYAIYSK